MSIAKIIDQKTEEILDLYVNAKIVEDEEEYGALTQSELEYREHYHESQFHTWLRDAAEKLINGQP